MEMEILCDNEPPESEQKLVLQPTISSGLLLLYVYYTYFPDELWELL